MLFKKLLTHPISPSTCLPLAKKRKPASLRTWALKLRNGLSNPEALGKVLDALVLPQFPHQNGGNAERCVPLPRSPDINITICGTVAEPVLGWERHILEADRNPC